MNEIGCAVEGCPEVFRTNEPVSPGARFICRNHSRRVQCANVPERSSYDEEKDNSDADIRLQDQFDRQLGGSSPFLGLDLDLEDEVADRRTSFELTPSGAVRYSQIQDELQSFEEKD